MSFAEELQYCSAFVDTKDPKRFAEIIAEILELVEEIGSPQQIVEKYFPEGPKTDFSKIVRDKST